MITVFNGYPKIGHKNTDGGWTESPNSAGGVSVKIGFRNDSPKTIKYIRFFVVPYNSVNDVVRCTVSGKSAEVLTNPGPYPTGDANEILWNNVWYNQSIRRADINHVEVEYMDGTKATFLDAQIKHADLPKPKGCYVATCVYGSYDCPQVWTLRRFRDDTLAATWYGRAFIRTYYAVSPTLVKWFGKYEWFRGMFRPALDHLVARLHSQGVADTSYQDRNW